MYYDLNAVSVSLVVYISVNIPFLNADVNSQNIVMLPEDDIALNRTPDSRKRIWFIGNRRPTDARERVVIWPRHLLVLVLYIYHHLRFTLHPSP